MAQPAWDTLTRTEALALRGYSPEVIAGNGAHVEAPPEVETDHDRVPQRIPQPEVEVLRPGSVASARRPCRLAAGPTA